MIYLRLALVTLVFAGGWMARGYKADSDELMIRKAVDKVVAEQSKIERESATNLELSLQLLNSQFMRVANERAGYINNPVYLNPCRDASGMRAINSLSRSSGDPGKPASKVP